VKHLPHREIPLLSWYFRDLLKDNSQLKEPPLGITHDSTTGASALGNDIDNGSTVTLITQQTAIFWKPWLSPLPAFNKAGCLATAKNWQEGRRQHQPELFYDQSELCYVCLVAFKVNK